MSRKLPFYTIKIPKMKEKNSAQFLQFKHKFFELLGSDLDESCKELERSISEKSAYFDEFIMVKGRLKQLRNKEIRGVVPSEEIELAENKIRVSLFNIVDSLTEADLKNGPSGEKKEPPLVEQNDEFQSLMERCEIAKSWLESNSKEFDYYFEEENRGKIEDDLEKLSSKEKLSNFRVKIAGTRMKIKFTRQLEEKLKLAGEADDTFFVRVLKDKTEYTLDLLDIASFKIENYKTKGVNGKNMFYLTLECGDGLSKIHAIYFVEKYRELTEENTWAPYREENDFHETYLGHFTLNSTNFEFLKAFGRRIVELKSLNRKMLE